MSKVCLISPGHLGSNPRLVKEADALAEAGYEVQVIYGDSYPPARIRDAALIAHAKWKATAIPLKASRGRYIGRRLKQRSVRFLFRTGWRSSWLACGAHHPLVPALCRAASGVRADLYIGHCLASLPAAVLAARRNRGKVGFDLEDFHSGEAEDDAGGRIDNQIAAVIEAVWLPHCHYLTAASPLIAEKYRELYCPNVTTILNVFPLSEAVEPKAPSVEPSFYWFSQTIGPGRGLEEFIGVLVHLDRVCSLDLRGHISPDYEHDLKALVKGTKIQLHFLEPGLPQSMVHYAAGYTAGLAIERRVPINRDLCLTNKAFTYLLAGLPVIFSRTKAQQTLAIELGDAGLVIDLEKKVQSATSLECWLNNDRTQASARSAASQLGRSRFNWDLEKEKFLGVVRSVMPRPSISDA